MSLLLEIDVGRTIRIGDTIVSLEQKSGRRARLSAPGVDVRRETASSSAVASGAAPLAA
jgi:hypothetical protein